MRWDLTGRVAIVTGASQNIGKAIAEALAEAGASLVISALDADELDAAAEEMRTTQRALVETVAGDLCEEGFAHQIADRALDAYGGVDIVVNNALIDKGERCALLEVSRPSWDRKFAGYLFSPLDLVARTTASMAERGHGSVINVVSGAALTPIVGMGAYGVSKATMWAMTRQLARELAPHVRVNALCPGTTTETGTIEQAKTEPLLRSVPLQRMGTARESAEAALFLASDASSYTTGQMLRVDGGRSELVSPV